MLRYLLLISVSWAAMVSEAGSNRLSVSRESLRSLMAFRVDAAGQRESGFGSLLRRINLNYFFTRVADFSEGPLPVLSPDVQYACESLLNEDPTDTSEECASAMIHYVERRLEYLSDYFFDQTLVRMRSFDEDGDDDEDEDEDTRAELEDPALLSIFTSVDCLPEMIEAELKRINLVPEFHPSPLHNIPDHLSDFIIRALQAKSDQPMPVSEWSWELMSSAVEFSMNMEISPTAIVALVNALTGPNKLPYEEKDITSLMAPENETSPDPRRYFLLYEERNMLAGIVPEYTAEEFPGTLELLAAYYSVSPQSLHIIDYNLRTGWSDFRWIRGQIERIGANEILRRLVRDLNISNCLLMPFCGGALTETCLRILAQSIARNQTLLHLESRIDIMNRAKHRNYCLMTQIMAFGMSRKTLISPIHLLRGYRAVSIAAELSQRRSTTSQSIPASGEAAEWTVDKPAKRLRAEQSPSDDVLSLSRSDLNSVFLKSFEFCRQLQVWPAESFVRIDGESDSETEWLQMLKSSREWLMLGPFGSSEEWKFFGRIVKLMLTKGMSPGLGFDKELVVLLFLPQFRSLEVPEGYEAASESLLEHADAFHSGFYDRSLPQLPARLSITNIGNFIYHGEERPFNGLAVVNMKFPRFTEKSMSNNFREVLVDEGQYQQYTLKVVRSRLLESSFHALAVVESLDDLTVEFSGERGIDGGGLSREWFNMVTNSLLSPKTGVFYMDRSSGLWRVSPQAHNCDNCADLFVAIGSILAYSVNHQIPIGIGFSPIFIKSLLGIDNIDDFAIAEPEIYKNVSQLGRINGQPLLDEETLQQYRDLVEPAGFVARVALPYGQTVDLNLRDHRPVIDYTPLTSDAEWSEYAQSRLRKLHQMEKAPPMLISRFTDLVGTDLMTFENLSDSFRGNADLSITDWRANTRCTNSEELSKKQQHAIELFWQVVGSLDIQEKKAFLKFWTALESIPHAGFSSLQSVFGKSLEIFVSDKPCPRFLEAHTCGFLLILPLAENIEEMRFALTESLRYNTSFGFA